MSKLDYCFESHTSPNIHAIKKKNMIWHVRQHSHQKFCFYHLPTRGRAGVKLGDADMSPTCLYFFYYSVLFYYQSWMFYNHYIVILYHFLVLTYWHSAKCQLLFSACFLHRRKSIPNGVQTQRTFCGFFPNKRHLVGRRSTWGAPMGAQPTRARLEAQARPGGLCPPRVPPKPPLCSVNTPIFQKP